MKRLLCLSALIVICLCATLQASFGIVNNSGALAADSFNIPFFAIDSAGDLTALTTNDSVFVVVFYPDGTKAYEDSAAFDNARITSESFGGYTVYNFADAIANWDGSAVEGVYSYILVVDDNTSAALGTPLTGHFQLYATMDFALALDSAHKPIGDTCKAGDDIYTEVQNLDAWNPGTGIVKVDTGSIARSAWNNAVVALASRTATPHTLNSNGDSAIDYTTVGAAPWNHSPRHLTAIDEDYTTLDLNGTTVGGLTAWDKTGYSLTPAERGAIEDSIHAHAADYKADVSGLSTFNPQTDAVYLAGDSTELIAQRLQWLLLYTGAQPGMVQIYYPIGGDPKDSIKTVGQTYIIRNFKNLANPLVIDSSKVSQ